MRPAKPRLGLAPAKASLRALEGPEATYVALRSGRRGAWYHYMNVVLGLKTGEARAHGERIVWLDSDIVVFGKPDALELGDTDGFGFVAGSKHGGTTGPDDPGERLWRAMCEATGLAVDDLPWTHSEMGGETVRCCFNVGAFALRRKPAPHRPAAGAARADDVTRQNGARARVEGGLALCAKDRRATPGRGNPAR